MKVRKTVGRKFGKIATFDCPLFHFYPYFTASENKFKKRRPKMGTKKYTIHVPEIDSQPNDHGNDQKIVILMDDNYDGLNIRQAMFLKVVLESWINFRGN